MGKRFLEIYIGLNLMLIIINFLVAFLGWVNGEKFILIDLYNDYQFATLVIACGMLAITEAIEKNKERSK